MSRESRALAASLAPVGLPLRGRCPPRGLHAGQAARCPLFPSNTPGGRAARAPASLKRRKLSPAPTQDFSFFSPCRIPSKHRRAKKRAMKEFGPDRPHQDAQLASRICLAGRRGPRRGRVASRCHRCGASSTSASRFSLNFHSKFVTLKENG